VPGTWWDGIEWGGWAGHVNGECRTVVVEVPVCGVVLPGTVPRSVSLPEHPAQTSATVAAKAKSLRCDITLDVTLAAGAGVPYNRAARPRAHIARSRAVRRAQSDAPMFVKGLPTVLADQ
jgi:hypothetical protein